MFKLHRLYELRTQNYDPVSRDLTRGIIFLKV